MEHLVEYLYVSYNMEAYPLHFRILFKGRSYSYPFAGDNSWIINIPPNPSAPILDEDWDVYVDYAKFSVNDVLTTTAAGLPTSRISATEDAFIAPNKTITLGLEMSDLLPLFNVPSSVQQSPFADGTSMVAFFEMPRSDPLTTGFIVPMETIYAVNNNSYFQLRDPMLMRHGGPIRCRLVALDAAQQVALKPVSFVVSMKAIKRRNITKKNPKVKHYG